jgi:hypothetical protein
MNTVIQLPSISSTSVLGALLGNLQEAQTLKVLVAGIQKGVEDRTFPLHPGDYGRIREQLQRLVDRGLLEEKDISWIR